MIETADLFLRFAAIGVLALLTIQFARHWRHAWLGPVGALFSLGIASYLVVGSALLHPHLGWAHDILLFPAVAIPLLLYLFSRALFDDDFAPGPIHGAVLLVLELTAYLHFAGVAGPGGPLMLAIFAINRLVALGVAAATLIGTLRGRVIDLIEGRRSFRVVFVAVVGTYVVLVLAVEAMFPTGAAPAWLDAANAGAILAVTLTLAVYMLPLRPELLAPRRGGVADAAKLPLPLIGTNSASTPSPRNGLDPLDRRILDALNKAMTADRLYRQEGLTISALATQLGTQEHRLRRLINQHLGYRNFATFLNEHRIAEVCAALADPAKARLPILTIAMDAGYRSLGPFNLAFKQATGLTPSEFRRRTLGSDSPPQSP